MDIELGSFRLDVSVPPLHSRAVPNLLALSHLNFRCIQPPNPDARTGDFLSDRGDITCSGTLGETLRIFSHKLNKPGTQSSSGGSSSTLGRAGTLFVSRFFAPAMVLESTSPYILAGNARIPPKMKPFLLSPLSFNQLVQDGHSACVGCL